MEEITRRLATQGLLRLSPEEAQIAMEQQMPELHKPEVLEYMGLRDNLEIMRMSQQVMNLFLCMDHIRYAYDFGTDLVTF